MNTTIDDLTLLKYLSKGGFAEIFLSRKIGVNELLATKRLKQEAIQKNPKLKQYLENEITILNIIKHPNIIRLYDVKLKPDYIYITMEYCNGGSLIDCFKKYYAKNQSPFSEDIVKYLMKQILQGIKCLHDHKIIHRDIKLGNILIKFNSEKDLQLLNILAGQVKIIDFNASTKPGSNTAQTAIGTFPNMAPSVLGNFMGNHNEYDEKVDIWSLGTICYEMLFGKELFNKEQILNYNSKDLPIDIPNFISVNARSFLLSMLQKDRQKRLSVNELLQHPFINSANNIINKQPNYYIAYPQNNIAQQQPLNIHHQIQNNQYQIQIKQQKINNQYQIQNNNIYQIPNNYQQYQAHYQIPNNINNQQNKIQNQIPNKNNVQIIQANQIHNYNNQTNKNQINNYIDNILLKLLEARDKLPGTPISLKEEEVNYIIDKSLPIIKNEEMLLEIEAPIMICGDIHGQFYDLLRIFEHLGYPNKFNYLFLGNYVDFGRQSIEVLCILLCYKIKYPKKIYLLRGNHESSLINRFHGFYDECKAKFNIKMFRAFTDFFNHLPVAALISEKIFCVHGGLSPDLKNVHDILSISRPTDIPEFGLLCDLLNSDPDVGVIEYDENDKGISITFGEKIVDEFIKKNNLDLIVRGNEVVDEGYEFFANRKLITVFSSPCFKGEYNNSAGVLSIDENLLCSVKVLRPK